MDGVAALLGAVVGAMGGLGGGWLSVMGQSRHQREQQRADRDRWRDEVRRDAYNGYMAATRQLNAAWWEAFDRLWAEGSTAADWQAGLVATHAAYANFSTARAAVVIAGPRSTAVAAEVLSAAMRKWEMTGVEWSRAAIQAGKGGLDEYDARFKVAAEAKRVSATAFQEAARIALGTDD